MNLEGFNLSNVCRLCLRSSKDLRNIFVEACSSEQPKMDLAVRISACVSLEIRPTDRGPQSICDKCLECVNNWYEFNEVCHVSNALLTKFLNVASDVSKKNINQPTDKPNILNENSLLPEISIMSHDSLLDRSCGLESNISLARPFSISPIPFQLDHFLSSAAPPVIPTASSSTSFTNAITDSSNNVASVSKNNSKCSSVKVAATSKKDLNSSAVNTAENRKRSTTLVPGQNQKIASNVASVARTKPTDVAPVPQENQKCPCVQCPAERRELQYSCEFCDLVFPKFIFLLSHDMEKHASMEKQPCSVCGRLFVSAGRLKMHVELVHRERSFRCDICDKMFSSRKSLKVHQRLHSEMYKCEKCGFVSTSKLYLNQHLKKHEGAAEVFVCATCRKQFAYLSSLQRHEKLHLQDKGKAFRCSVCQLTVRSGFELKQHLSSHEDVVEEHHRCHICNKDLNSKRALAMHLRRHEPKRFVCEICDKAMFSRYDLRLHRETHGDCKAYSCFHCDKKFSFKNTLVRHVKEHCSAVPSNEAS